MNFISLLEIDKQDCWFQQDGSTAHTANSTMQMLSIIYRNMWLPPSPDLSPPEFYLWGVLKENVYRKKLHTLEKLKQNI
jgi:hypothetical protein